jgi:phosphoribosyl-ATP pyrophosphohydrolase
MPETRLADLEVLARLAETIASRRSEDASRSYTASLIAAGLQACAKKVGEEAVEVAMAAVSEPGRLPEEAADLLYHLLVLLEARGVTLTQVLDVLKSREGRGGHAEKASRQKG